MPIALLHSRGVSWTESQFQLIAPTTESPGTVWNYSHKAALQTLETASAFLLLFTAAFAGLSGCDPVRTIRHRILVRVLDDRGAPAPDVSVRMKESWESWETSLNGIPEAEMDYHRNRWLHEQWLEGVTGARGEALIWNKVTALDWNKGSEPPPERDVVSNREYVIEVSRQNDRERVHIVMKRGAVGKGNWCTVTIEAIGKPVYVQEPDETGR